MANNTDRAHLTTTGDGSRPGSWLPMDGKRVSVARYDPGLNQIHVIFTRDGTPWVYDQVPRNIWRNFRRSTSPGRYINRILNGYPYFEGSFSYSGHLDSSDAEEGNVDVESVQERQQPPSRSRIQYTGW